MALDNEQVVREAIEAWNAGDRERVLEWLDPEAEIRTMRAELEGRPYRGHDGFRKALADFDEDWDYTRFDVRDTRSSGPFVVIRCNLRSRAKTSGIELDVPLGWVWEFRDGWIVRMQSYSEPDDAFRDAGIEP
jgi:uncharacterized protein